METTTVNGYVLDSTPREVTVSTNGQSVSVSVTNTLARASIVVSKTDYETGAPLSGVHFTLSDSNGTLVDPPSEQGEFITDCPVLTLTKSKLSLTRGAL